MHGEMLFAYYRFVSACGSTMPITALELVSATHKVLVPRVSGSGSGLPLP